MSTIDCASSPLPSPVSTTFPIPVSSCKVAEMMAAPLMITVLAILLLVVASTPTARLETVSLETGYSVTTVLDGNKLPTPIHPYSIVPRPNGEPTLLLLDSADSAFYSFSPLSQDGGMVKLAGSGVSGYADGGREVAMFARPKSFTVDAKANVYVADRSNHVIRKITPSGITTTISGGFSQKTGNMDGPAQNATFSDDFEVVFIPKMCALLISDRGNSLVRRMDLKQEDCVYESQKGGLGTTSVSIIAVLCALFGSVVGFVARPFLVSHTGNLQQSQTHQDVEALPNQSEAVVTDSLLRHQKRSC